MSAAYIGIDPGLRGGLAFVQGVVLGACVAILIGAV